MIELAAITVVAAVATTFALDILRPTLRIITHRTPKRTRTTVDGHTVEAHAVH